MYGARRAYAVMRDIGPTCSVACCISLLGNWLWLPVGVGLPRHFICTN